MFFYSLFVVLTMFITYYIYGDEGTYSLFQIIITGAMDSHILMPHTYETPHRNGGGRILIWLRLGFSCLLLNPFPTPEDLERSKIF